VTRAFNEFFFLTCKIFHSPPLLPLDGEGWREVNRLILSFFLGLSKSVQFKNILDLFCLVMHIKRQVGGSLLQIKREEESLHIF
jgi:hypothetical protein